MIIYCTTIERIVFEKHKKYFEIWTMTNNYHAQCGTSILKIKYFNQFKTSINIYLFVFLFLSNFLNSLLMITISNLTEK